MGPAFAAQLGGEEFLVVFGGPVGRLDEIRAAVADHPWRPIVGDLPVTVSVGAAAVEPGSTQASLLAAADACLYEAKRAGRNRVRQATRSGSG